MSSDGYDEFDMDKHVGSNVQRFRVARGMSQSDLAEAMSQGGERVHQQTILKIEKGTRPLKYAEAARLSDVLQVPMSAFMEAPVRAESEAKLLTLAHHAADIKSDLDEYARNLAPVLVQLATEIAINRARRAEDQASAERVKAAIGLVQTNWGAELSRFLRNAIIMQEPVVHKNMKALDIEDHTTILAGIAAMDVQQIARADATA